MNMVMVLVYRTKSESVILNGFISMYSLCEILQDVVQLVNKSLVFDEAQYVV
jgi:hypothetical protein